MALYINDAVIEVTRKCNLKCQHCLRGNAQRKNIPNNYIYKFLQLIDSIHSLTITGGEPTLNMEGLEQIRNCIVYSNCEVDNFYMVTNGKSIHIDELAEWIYLMYLACSDNEISGVNFSFDSFHTSILNWKQSEKQKRNFYRLQEIIENKYGLNRLGGDFIRKHSDKSWGYHSLINEGRAKGYGSRENEVTPFEMFSQEFDDDGSADISENEVYLSCSGYIVAGCDWSYESIDNRKDIRICHIDDINCQDDFINALTEYNKKLEVKELQTV